jgi:hypothetical protein
MCIVTIDGGCVFVGEVKMYYSEMHGMDNFKVADAKQAKTTNTYRSVKLKFLKTNAAIWFTKLYKNNYTART